MNKRAQVETQFNWIFILVVGAIIMIFFVAIVMRQKASSEVKISETVMTDLQSIFTGGSVSTGTSQLIETPKVKIGFDCANYYLSGVTKPAENLIIFAPSLVQGRNIVTWTLDYNLPYKITNFLYITTPEMRYIFVLGGGPNYNSLVRRWNSTLPRDMNKEFVKSVNEIEDKNNYKVRLIFFSMGDKAVPSELKYLRRDLTALLIEDTDLRFFEYDGSDFVEQEEIRGVTKTYVVDYYEQQLKPSLYGAIFTDDVAMYNCMIRKALKRAYFVSSVYAKRNRNISDYFEATNSYCDLHKYDPDEFDDYVRYLDGYYPNFPDPLNSPRNIIEAGGWVSGIKRQNEVLLQRSCTLIY